MTEPRAGRHHAPISPARGVSSRPSYFVTGLMFFIGGPVDALLRRIGVLK